MLSIVARAALQHARRAASRTVAAAPVAVRTAATDAAAGARRPGGTKPIAFRGMYFNKDDASFNMRYTLPKYAITEHNNFRSGSTVSQGRVIIELAPAKPAKSPEGRTMYDYTGKLQIALSAGDLLYLSSTPFTGEEVAITKGRAPGPGVEASVSFRKLSIAALPGKQGMWKLTLTGAVNKGAPASSSSSDDDAAAAAAAGGVPAGGGHVEVSTIETTITQSELVLMRHLFNQTIVWVTGWMQSLNPATFIPAMHTYVPPATSGGGAGGAGTAE